MNFPTKFCPLLKQKCRKDCSLLIRATNKEKKKTIVKYFCSVYVLAAKGPDGIDDGEDCGDEEHKDMKKIHFNGGNTYR